MAILILASGCAFAADSDSLLEALEGTKPLIDLRARSEDVGQYGKDEAAEADTIRGRFGFQTGAAWDTSLLAEGVALVPLPSDYNSTLNHQTQYPTVADPEQYGLNRLQLLNTSIPRTTLIVGRERINLDDQRFIGSVNWRQLEQTFDAAQLINTSIPGLTVDLTYLNRVNRVYGHDSPQGTYPGNNYLANAAYQTPFGKLVGFTYILDFDIDPTDSTRTYGARFSGGRSLGLFDLGYSASYAQQRQNANNPLRFSDSYYQGELSAGLQSFRATVGIEVLDGNGTKGFTTPLATLHIFQGWVDQFLTTPPNGIDDRYASIGYATRRVRLFDSFAATLVYHDFHSQRLGLDYGTEIDAMLKGSWGKLSALIAYGDYTAKGFATDTHKLWFELGYIL
ncbi:MAG: hypothetical protein ACREUT_06165 [Steroidobacteraceae bacterium]